MRRWLPIITGVLLLLCFLYSCWIWGGLARAPDIGPVVLDASQRELSLASIYRPVGTQAIDLLGLESAARHTSARFASVHEAIRAQPSVAMDTLRRAMPGDVALAYHGTPWLLLGFALAWWTRPRQLRTFSRR